MIANLLAARWTDGYSLSWRSPHGSNLDNIFCGPNIPRHALHEKGLHRQIRIGTLVSSKDRRAADVPRVNRLSTAGFVLASLYMGFRLFVFPTSCAGHLSSMLLKANRTVVPWSNRPIGVQSCPAPPGPAAPPCLAPPRLACGVSRFWVRQVNLHHVRNLTKFYIVSIAICSKDA